MCMIFLFGLVEIKWFLRVEKSLGYVTLLKKTWPLSVCANPTQNKKTGFVKCITRVFLLIDICLNF